MASWFGIDVCQKHTDRERKGEAEEHKGPRNLGLSKRMTPRVGRYPAWLKEQKEKEKKKADASSDEPESFEEFLQISAKRPRFVKKFIKAAKRVQKANKKLVAFERGFIHEDGIKDREWYRHLGVAPGKWLGMSGLISVIVRDFLFFLFFFSFDCRIWSYHVPCAHRGFHVRKECYVG